jgi:phosphomannomutase
METGRRIVERIMEQGEAAVSQVFGEAWGSVETIDFTDGARITLSTGDTIHLRPSGNAPEFRCYTESSSEKNASEINRAALGKIRVALDGLLLP